MAGCDDGSCNTVYGCMDPTAFNYDASATCSDSTSCIAGELGCIDPTASNYDSTANTNDGYCYYCNIKIIIPLYYNFK